MALQNNGIEQLGSMMGSEATMPESAQTGVLSQRSLSAAESAQHGRAVGVIDGHTIYERDGKHFIDRDPEQAESTQPLTTESDIFDEVGHHHVDILPNRRIRVTTEGSPELVKHFQGGATNTLLAPRLQLAEKQSPVTELPARGFAPKRWLHRDQVQTAASATLQSEGNQRTILERRQIVGVRLAKGVLVLGGIQFIFTTGYGQPFFDIHRLSGILHNPVDVAQSDWHLVTHPWDVAKKLMAGN